jgi:hypothetical protein
MLALAGNVFMLIKFILRIGQKHSMSKWRGVRVLFENRVHSFNKLRSTMKCTKHIKSEVYSTNFWSNKSVFEQNFEQNFSTNDSNKILIKILVQMIRIKFWLRFSNKKFEQKSMSRCCCCVKRKARRLNFSQRFSKWGIGGKKPEIDSSKLYIL